MDMNRMKRNFSKLRIMEAFKLNLFTAMSFFNL